ncbi:MAG: GntR family transcriptional regulator [Clostridiales bacterium]|nr:GntR family transcriptional regulator [Clostridiales bacterium]
MKIIISNNASIPIYKQIESQIKDAIFKGDVKENDMLPSMRQLSKELKVSVITTMRAYNDLEEEGYIVNIQGKGCFVQPQHKELIREKALYEVEQFLQEAIKLSILYGIGKDELIEILEVLYITDPI